MTRTNQSRPMSPQEANAIIRRRQWEQEAEKARDRSFWRKRFDLIDLALAVFATVSALIALWGFLS